MQQGMNDTCSCGSGKKHQDCCQGKMTPPSREPSQVELLQLGNLFNTGRYVELEKSSRALIGQYPASGLIWELLGQALQMQGKDSLHAFQKTVEFLPDDAGAHYNLAAILKSLGKLSEAAAGYRNAIKIKPNFVEALNNLGNIMVDLEQFSEAIESFHKALNIKPDSAEAHLNMGVSLACIGQLNKALA